SDPCCRWYYISEELTGAFVDADGTCNALARASIRMGFHDAGTWSSKLIAAGQDYGGADGSLVLFDEIKRPENFGLESAVGFAQQLYNKYNVTMADLIQYMANHAVVSCPLGPRVRTYVGRKDATQAAPDGLLPSVHAPAEDLIALFVDKTISAHELTALLGAHTTSTQRGVDGSKAGYPQDTTPGVWDVKYYNETLDTYENDCIFKFESDVKLSKHPTMSGEWQKFVGDQGHWNGDYARAYLRLSLLGVKNINQLKECTLTLPAQQGTVPKNADID
ncbi:heme peroxidase, partial [Setomelanomma holmii]